MKKTSAFTLAETLITLVIIGVVAAMTLPGLTESYKRKENSVRLKKFYTTMEQAIQQLNGGNFDETQDRIDRERERIPSSSATQQDAMREYPDKEDDDAEEEEKEKK